MLARSREVLLLLVLALVPAVAVSWLWAGFAGEEGEAWGFPVLGATYYLALVAGLVWIVSRWQVDVAELFGPWPSVTRLAKTLGLTVPVVLLSNGTFYLVHYALGAVAPELTERLLNEPLLIREEGLLTVLPNLAWAFLAVVGGPFVEEVLFRGFLLRRWSRKWNFQAAVLLSSMLFGLLHFSDFVGTTLFGIVMAVLYVKAGSLWAPIALHAAHNLVIFVLVWVEELAGVGPETSLAEFRSAWWIGALSLAIGGPWIVYWLKTNWPGSDWSFRLRGAREGGGRPAVGLVLLAAGLVASMAAASNAPGSLDWTLGEWRGVRRDAASGRESSMILRVEEILGGAGHRRELEISEDGEVIYHGFAVQVPDDARGVWVREYTNAGRGWFSPLEGTVESETMSVWRGVSPTRKRESKLISERVGGDRWRRTMTISEDGGESWRALWIDDLKRVARKEGAGR